MVDEVYEPNDFIECGLKKNKRNGKHTSLKTTCRPKKHDAIFKALCTRFVAFYSLIHRTRPPQIQALQGFSPGGTSSASQARSLPLGGRLRSVLDRGPKAFPVIGWRASAGCRWHPRQGTASAVDEV